MPNIPPAANVAPEGEAAAICAPAPQVTYLLDRAEARRLRITNDQDWSGLTILEVWLAIELASGETVAAEVRPDRSIVLTVPSIGARVIGHARGCWRHTEHHSETSRSLTYYDCGRCAAARNLGPQRSWLLPETRLVPMDELPHGVVVNVCRGHAVAAEVL
jgi:hypothetical protein